jgi:NADH-quinone oxidoreductase subunit G
MTATESNTNAEAAPVVDPNEVLVTINGRQVAARKGELIIAAAERTGTYIPRFCYHERMSSVGMCRMCLCEVDSGRGPALMPTCMFPVAPGMVITTESPASKAAQEGVIELLLANHPLDCPVCDKGGECPLQDQSFSHGPGESRFVEEKRHYEKPIPISDLVFLDRERCILCDRCTRFADEVAGDPLISFTHRGNETQVLTFPGEPFVSYFSGNTVQICPVGALTASPYRFKARPWDLEQGRSTCTSCAVGCQTVVQSSRDELLRYQGHDSDAVNWGWMCDRGRFNFESSHHEMRLGTPAVKSGDQLVEASWADALAKAAELITTALDSDGPAGIGIIGGARGSNEDAYAWAQLARTVLGTDNVDAQLLDGLPDGLLRLPRATINETVAASTIVLLCGDLKEELPVLYLRLRDAAVKRGVKILEFTPKASGLSKYAWRSVSYLSGGQARVVRDTVATADVADQLAKGPVVVVAGTANLAESDQFQVDALAAVLAAAPGATVLPAYRRGNTVGALQLGLTPLHGGMHTDEILTAAAEGRIALLILLGSDPLSDFPDTTLADRALAGARSIIAVDTFVTSSSQHADVVLAAAAYGEKRGTTTNIEGRVVPLAQMINAHGTSRPDWMIAGDLAAVLGSDLGFGSVDEVTDAISRSVAAYAGATREALAAATDGVLAVAAPDGVLHTSGVEVPMSSGYNFQLVVGRKLYDQAISTQLSHSLAGLTPGAKLHLHPLDLDRLGGPGAPLRVSSKSASVVLTAVADDGVPRGAAWVEFNQANINIAALVDSTSLATDIRVETVS